MALRAVFRAAEGGAEYPIDQPMWTCPASGSLLDVVHDLTPLRATSADAWRALFEKRRGAVRAPYDSGVWAKHEWVAPWVSPENIVSLGEGFSPLVLAKLYGRGLGVPQVWIKQCGTSHTGSFKDLGMTVLVSSVVELRARGRDVRAVACASTGDTSAALAAYGAAAGLETLVLLPKGKISTAQLVQPLAHGAAVLALDTDFDGCMALVRRLAEEEGVYLANSMNPLRLEGQKTVALEIAEQMQWQAPDWVVIPGGNLGNVSALAAGFAMARDLGLLSGWPRICVAQAERANPLHSAYERGFDLLQPMAAQATLASAIQIGNPVSYSRAVRALQAHDGVVEQATENELAAAAARADKTGMFACPHTAVALASLEKLVARGLVKPEHRVVVVSTASGLKFVDFKVRYHERALADVTDYSQANPPVSLPGTWEPVRDHVRRLLDRRA